jgi:hydrogenase expression/formation protein HypC
MCIGLPMQVIAIEPGHAHCAGRSETRCVNTALVGPVRPGDWLLIFIDSAQERISRERAEEINGTLDLMQAALQGDVQGLDASFQLPSVMSREQLLALSGAPEPHTLETSHEH